jgi:hypothetical protein
MKKIPDFFEISASSKALKKEVLEDVFPLFNKKIEVVEKAFPLVYNNIMQDQELISKNYVLTHVKYMSASVETHMSMAKSNMSCIKSWFECYQLITEKEAAIIESLLEIAKEAIASAERILGELKSIFDRKDVLFQQYSPGSESIS